MRPFLFSNTIFETPTYFVLFMLAGLAGIILASRRAELFKLSPLVAIDMGMVVFFAGILGARLMHIVAEAPAYYKMHPVRVFYFWQGGFVLYGGLILGTIAGVLFLRFKKQNLRDWMDLIAPAIFLGIAIGRMGCLAAGCCFGSETDAWYGMVFTDPRSAAPLQTPLFPTQLSEALFAFVLCLILHFSIRKPMKRSGLSLVIGFAAYAIFRFLIEFVRGDADRGLYHFDHWTISTSQYVSLGVLILCLVFSALFFLKPNFSKKSSRVG